MLLPTEVGFIHGEYYILYCRFYLSASIVQLRPPLLYPSKTSMKDSSSSSSSNNRRRAEQSMRHSDGGATTRVGRTTKSSSSKQRTGDASMRHSDGGGTMRSTKNRPKGSSKMRKTVSQEGSHSLSPKRCTGSRDRMTTVSQEGAHSLSPKRSTGSRASIPIRPIIASLAGGTGAKYSASLPAMNKGQENLVQLLSTRTPIPMVP